MPSTSSGVDTRTAEWTPVARMWLLGGVVVALVALVLAAAAGTWIGVADLATGPGPVGYHPDMAPWDIVKTTMPIAAGVGGLVALALALHRHQVAEATRFAAQSADATALLEGSPAAVRIAGVHAMAALADASNDRLRRQQCIDALSAYLRGHYRPARVDVDAVGARGSVHSTSSTTPQERDVRLAIISVIREHLVREAPISWAGHDLDFSGAVFDGGSFRGAEFGGGLVSFRGATFTGALTSFRQVRFTGGQVFFDDTTFTGGPVSFDQTKFTGARVFFDRARFVDAAVSFDRSRFTSGQVSFDDAVFAGGRVSFHSAQFTGAPVSFDGAGFAGAQVSFQRARFTGGPISMDGATVTGGRVSFDLAGLAEGFVSFRGVSFDGGHLSMERMRLSGGRVSFHDATFGETVTSFRQAKVGGAHISFRGATFATGSRICFGGVDFTDGQVYLQRAAFTGGTVDLRCPHTWIRPPHYPGSMPAGLLMPSVEVGSGGR